MNTLNYHTQQPASKSLTYMEYGIRSRQKNPRVIYTPIDSGNKLLWEADNLLNNLRSAASVADLLECLKKSIHLVFRRVRCEPRADKTSCVANT